MSEATAGVFRHAAVQNIFANTGGRVLMLVMLPVETLPLPGFFGRFFG